MKRKFKYLILTLSCGAILTASSCKEWLEIYPENAQPSGTYWQTKEEVESVLMSGYYYLRELVIPTLIPYGELRAGCIFNTRSYGDLQRFMIKPTDKKLCDWGGFYKIINVANTVIKNAPLAQERDATYDISVMRSHQSEAYFLRALAYFYLVRNWREVPLIIEPYEDDSYTTKVPKSSEADIIAQIREDIRMGLASGAKESFDTNWETKGRGTKWALYALGADVCLWAEDYEAAITYCDGILNAQGAGAPVFLSTPSHSSWFSMFNPGNSNESIFEIQWNYEEDQTNTLPILFDDSNADREYVISESLTHEFADEYIMTSSEFKEEVRTLYGGFYASAPEGATTSYVWKYMGSQTKSDKRTPTYYDPNFIIYRVAEVILMKAEALVLRSNGEDTQDKIDAMKLINQIRTRSNLKIETNATPEDVEALDEEAMLEKILYERKMELVGEGKMWYDFLRFGRRDNNKYKSVFLIDNCITYNQEAGEAWLRTVLGNDNALFLPISKEELDANDQLVQNPYYK